MKRAALILCVMAVFAFESGLHPVTRAKDSALDPQPGQSAGCRAAVARLQKAVTTEAHAYADARRTMCRFMSLPAEYREGKPQAINDSMQRNLSDARGESAAANKAAAGCNTSGVKRPEIVGKPAADAYISCVGGPDMSCQQLTGAAFDRCIKEDRMRTEARAQKCRPLLEQVDCQGLEVVEQNEQTETEGEPVVTLPADLNPDCRDAYLQSVTAERDYASAQKRVQEITPKFGAAGARGTAMYNAARADLQRASTKKAEAERKLSACKALNGDDTTATTTNQQTPPGERPCTADERAAFAKLTGSWKAYPMSISIGGSCEQTTGTYQVAEWCGDVNGPDRSEIYSGAFTGRMEGGGISVAWTQDAGKRHPNLTGQAGCSLNGDGTLSCRGFGPPSCGPGDAKKQ